MNASNRTQILAPCLCLSHNKLNKIFFKNWNKSLENMHLLRQFFPCARVLFHFVFSTIERGLLLAEIETHPWSVRGESEVPTLRDGRPPEGAVKGGRSREELQKQRKRTLSFSYSHTKLREKGASFSIYQSTCAPYIGNMLIVLPRVFGSLATWRNRF